MEQTPDVEPDDHAAYQLRAMAEEAGVELGGSETTDELAAAINDARRHKLAAKRRELAVEEKTKMRPGERIASTAGAPSNPTTCASTTARTSSPETRTTVARWPGRPEPNPKGGTDPL